MNIPKIIHQIWLQGENQLPTDLKPYKEKIIKLHPEWQYKFWDEIEILKLIKNNDELINKYYKFNYLHQKVDFAKLIILYNYGGICIDMDAYTVKKLDTLYAIIQDYDLIVSKLKNIGFIGNYNVCNKFSQCLNNGNYIGKPKSDILKFMIDAVTTDCNIFDYKIKCIHKTTGPLFFNNIINNYIKNNPNGSKVKFLDNEYLEPCTMNVCDDITDETYVIHKHANTWINSYVKKLGIIYIKYQKFISIIVILIIILLIYIITKKILKY